MGRTCEGSGAGLPVRPHERGDRSCGLPGRLLSHTSKPPSSNTPHPSQNKLLFKPTPGKPSASCYFCSGPLGKGYWPWGEGPLPQRMQSKYLNTQPLILSIWRLCRPCGGGLASRKCSGASLAQFALVSSESQRSWEVNTWQACVGEAPVVPALTKTCCDVHRTAL